MGPSIVLAALSYAAIGAIMTYLWPDTCLIRAIPYPVFLVTGASLLVFGVPMLVVAAVALTRNYDRDQLATRGIYGVVRNPIYSAWIVFLIPGLVLLTRSSPASPYTLGGDVSSSRRGSSGKKSIWRSDSGTPISSTGPRSTNCCPFPGSDDREPAR